MGPGAGPWGLPARSNDRNKALGVVAAIVCAVDAVLNMLYLFSPQSAWKNPIDEATILLLTAAWALTAALLVPQRTRGFGAGLAIGQALTETARYVDSVRPSFIDQWNWVEKFANIGTYGTTAVAGILVAIVVLRERRSTTNGPRQTVPALVLGVPGTILAVLGLLFADYEWVYSGGSFSYTCCSWSRSDGLDKTSYVLTALALIGCVLLTALVGRIGFAKGVLAGAAVFLLTQAVVSLITTFAPTQAAYGFGGSGGPGITLIAHAKSGLWFALAGMLLFVIAFFILGTGADRGVAAPSYPGAPGPYPGATPGYPQQGFPQQGAPQQGYPQQGYAPQSGFPPQAQPQSGFGQAAWQQPAMPQQQGQQQGAWQQQPQPQPQPQSQPSQSQAQQPSQPEPQSQPQSQPLQPPPLQPPPPDQSWPPAPPRDE